MSDGGEDGGFTLTFNKKQLWVIFIVAALTASTVLAATSFLTNEVAVSNRITVGTDGSGMEVTITGDFDLELSDDWAKTNEVILNTSEGNMSVSSTGATSATVDVTEIDGSYTKATSIDASAANITFNPDDKNETTVGGGVTMVNFTDVKVEDGVDDLTYTATSTGTIIVTTNATEGTSYGLVDPSTNEGLDIATADADGKIHFTDVPAKTDQTVQIRELGTLFIREETSPHDKITSGTATVRFFEQTNDDPTIVERTATDGAIDLTGLPVDESFVATVKAGGYHNRTVVIDDLSQQKTAFLVNKTNITIDTVTFVINDDTGDFGAGSDFVVQKSINRSKYNGTPDGFSWTNIAGDEIGSTNQLTVDLIHEDRYRMRISSDTETRLLGSHTAETDQTVTVTIRDVTIELKNVSTDIAVGFEKDEDQSQIEFLYNDTEDKTTDLNVTIYERGNSSNKAHDQVHAGPFGELFIEESLNSREMNQSWVVEFNGTRDDDTVSGQYITGGRGDIGISAIPSWVQEFASVFAILLIPTVLGGARAETAAVISTAVAGLLWYIRWLPPEISIMSILLAGTIAVGFKLRQLGRGNIA